MILVVVPVICPYGLLALKGSEDDGRVLIIVIHVEKEKGTIQLVVTGWFVRDDRSKGSFKASSSSSRNVVYVAHAGSVTTGIVDTAIVARTFLRRNREWLFQLRALLC